MPTEKPRFTVTMDEGLFEQIENFKFNGRYKNQTKAVIALIEKGLEVISAEDPEVAEVIKNPPSTAEAAPGEGRISMEESDRLLVALGLIEEGQDLSDDDLAFLEHIIGLLDAWFRKHS